MSSARMTLTPSWRMWCVLVIMVASLHRISAQSEDDNIVSPSGADQDHQMSYSWVAGCLMEKDSVDCLESRTSRVLNSMRNERKVLDSRGNDADPQIDDLLEEAEEDFVDLISPQYKTSSPEKKDFDREGRGHKLKKKIHKIIKIIKIIVFIVVVKLKMVFLMLVGQTLFQFKLMFMTFILLAIKKYKIYLEWKHKKEASKVVYYEHAQHQHHYDETDHFHDGLGGLLAGHGHGYKHEVEPSAGSAPGWGGLWGKRSYEGKGGLPVPISAAVPGAPLPSLPGLGSPSGYRQPPLSAQELAYGVQSPH